MVISNSRTWSEQYVGLIIFSVIMNGCSLLLWFETLSYICGAAAVKGLDRSGAYKLRPH